MRNEDYLNEIPDPPAEEISVVEAIRIGLEQVRQGKTKPAKEFLEELRKKLNIPDKPQQ